MEKMVNSIEIGSLVASIIALVTMLIANLFTVSAAALIALKIIWVIAMISGLTFIFFDEFKLRRSK